MIKCDRPYEWFFPPHKNEFKPESDGQLNLFELAEDIEPPDPDDYPNLQAYQNAWVEWEKTKGKQ